MPHWPHFRRLAANSHLQLFAKHPTIMWSLFTIFSADFSKKSVGKSAGKVASGGDRGMEGWILSASWRIAQPSAEKSWNFLGTPQEHLRAKGPPAGRISALHSAGSPFWQAALSLSKSWCLEAALLLYPFDNLDDHLTSTVGNAGIVVIEQRSHVCISLNDCFAQVLRFLTQSRPLSKEYLQIFFSSFVVWII